jgi:hypothetical protein
MVNYSVKVIFLISPISIAISKLNPEFEYGKSARIEVRPIKVKEESTGFVYPKKD